MKSCPERVKNIWQMQSKALSWDSK